MAFFFSAISAQGPSKSKGKKQASAPEPEGDDCSNDEVLTSQVASNTSPVWLADHSTVVDEKLRPTINYWIALTTPNGAPASPIFIHRCASRLFFFFCNFIFFWYVLEILCYNSIPNT